MIYYHFTGKTLRDGSPIPAIGEWLEHKGEVKMCESGFHASVHPSDALAYAPGEFLNQVELDGIEDSHSDKVVARRRKIVASIDATELLWRCSRKFALEVIDLWDAPQIVREYLETGDESKRDAAWDAARASAGDAAGAAAGAARDAAWAAAACAARYAAGAARDVAWAARYAAGYAAGAAACAARDAAWAAAACAAREKQRALFLAEVEAEFARAK